VPPRDETGVVPDTPDVVDGLVIIVVYKDSNARKRGMDYYTGIDSRFAYTYGKNTLIQLQAFAPPELDAAFVDAMKHLKVHRVSEHPPATHSP